MEGILEVADKVGRLTGDLKGERRLGHAAQVGNVPGLVSEPLRLPEGHATGLKAYQRTLFGEIDPPSFEGFVRWANSLRQRLKVPEDDPRPIIVVRPTIESATSLTPEVI